MSVIAIYEDSRSWSDEYNHDIFRIFENKGYSCVLADDHDDCKLATDMYICKDGRTYSVACRIRNATEYRDGYEKEFTIRTSRPSGTTTEMEKILSGHGDIMIYGFGCGGKIVTYVILDLHVFRSKFAKFVCGDKSMLFPTFDTPKSKLMKNTDGTIFSVYKIDDFEGIRVKL